MTSREITNQLTHIAMANNFAARSAEITNAWSSVGVGIEAVEPVLRFIEEHPSIDIGAPGALVHFIEQFFGGGYEEKLLDSISRHPTSATIWMLNRVINGTKSIEVRRRFVMAMDRATANPLADQNTIRLANQFLERLSQ